MSPYATPLSWRVKNALRIRGLTAYRLATPIYILFHIYRFVKDIFECNSHIKYVTIVAIGFVPGAYRMHTGTYP